MLRSISELNGLSIVATDGELGSVEDAYFDDEKWAVRHLVIDTGGWLGGRSVLISPMAVEAVDWAERTVRLRLTKDQIESSPGVDTERPVSRQQEMALYDHYGYPYYWNGPFIWGASAFPVFGMVPTIPDPNNTAANEERAAAKGDPHLRSVKEVTGYAVRATDDAVGHVEDLLFDEEDWSLQMMVIDPHDWWPGKHVVISLKHAQDISWESQKVEVNLSRADIENSPEYDPATAAHGQAHPSLWMRSGRFR